MSSHSKKQPRAVGEVAHTLNDLTKLARASGLGPVHVSAKQLRRTSPQRAHRWATFIERNRNTIVAAVVKGGL